MPATVLIANVPTVLLDDVGIGVTTGGVTITYNADHPNGLLQVTCLGDFTGLYKENVNIKLTFADNSELKWRGEVLSIVQKYRKMTAQTHTYTIKLSDALNSNPLDLLL